MQPGYGWSTPPPLDRGFTMEDCAELLHELMVGLGYEGGYAVQVSRSNGRFSLAGTETYAEWHYRVATSERRSLALSQESTTLASACTSTCASILSLVASSPRN